ncbi:MAG: hypothetical protein M3Y32_09285, partial [Pseudomonadota bacterium]|nr:hypothetical protein [Pseudomonadota bacterium]
YLQLERMAALIKSKNPALNFQPEAGNPFDNMTRLQGSQTTLAWGLSPLVIAAFSGKPPYAAPHIDVRLVMAGLGYVDTLFCVPSGSPIRSVREIFEKKMPIRIGAGRLGTLDEWELQRIFQFYNTTFSEFRRRGGSFVFGSFPDLLGRIRVGELDALIFDSSVPATKRETLEHGQKLRILPMDDDLLADLEQFGMFRTIVEGGSYGELVSNDIGSPTAAAANTIVTNAKAPENVVHDLVKVLLDNLDALRALSPALAQFDPNDATAIGGVPLHPGAERAYREAGLLK